MEIFIATSIKSFDLNPTHPGPLPRVSQRKQSGETARSATDEEVTSCKNRRAANKTNWQAASNTLQGQRVAASFCAQETTSAEKCIIKQPQRLGDDFEFAFSCNAPPAWKSCAAQSQERFDRESAQRADQA